MQTSTPLPERAVLASINVKSILSNRRQTTVPEALPGALRHGKGDKIRYYIRPSGEVLLSRPAGRQADDPSLGQFLGFLASDMARHPERLQVVDAGLEQRLQSLVGGIEVDLNAALPAHVE